MVWPVVAHLGPDGDHQPRVQRVQIRHHLAGVREALRIKRLLPPQVFRPGQPVEHNAIQGDLPRAVFLDHLDQLGLRLISLFRLDVAIGPLGQHALPAGQPAHSRDDLVEFRAIEEIKIHLVFYVAPVIGSILVVVEIPQGTAIEKEGIPPGGDEHRHGNLQVVMVHQLAIPAVVEDPFLVLAQAIDRLAFGQDQAEARGKRLAIRQSDLPQHLSILFWLARQQVPRAIRPGEGTGAPVDGQAEALRAQHHLVFFFNGAPGNVLSRLG